MTSSRPLWILLAAQAVAACAASSPTRIMDGGRVSPDAHPASPDGALALDVATTDVPDAGALTDTPAVPPTDAVAPPADTPVVPPVDVPDAAPPSDDTGVQPPDDTGVQPPDDTLVPPPTDTGTPPPVDAGVGTLDVVDESPPPPDVVAVVDVPPVDAGPCGAGCPGSMLCCSAGCVDPTASANCGQCGNACAAGTTCTAGQCAQFASTGADGPFAPTSDIALTAGVHNYTTISIPSGVVVTILPDPSGMLDLRATGAVQIDGVIDLSGGNGTTGSSDNTPSTLPDTGHPGNGGNTGSPTSATGDIDCADVSGVDGLGQGPVGTVAGCSVSVSFICGATDRPAQGAQPGSGGGAGLYINYRRYGAGGGGPAGGGPGALTASFDPVYDTCTAVKAGGGTLPGQGGSGGGGAYDGAPGSTGSSPCSGAVIGTTAPLGVVGGGGGGAIGVAASADLAMAHTFRPGSGGGGGSADFNLRPASGPTAGGGGGGGALRISSSASITVGATGAVRANGGNGGDAFTGVGTAGACNPEPGAAGGGGSGGAIFLYAPAVTVAAGAHVSAVGGAGGAASRIVGANAGAGGAGGLGRVRISAGPGAGCALAGTFAPPLASGCAPTSGAGSAGYAFLATWPG